MIIEQRGSSVTRTMTATDVARRLNISSDRVRQLTRAGAFAVTETPLGRLYDAADVERVAREREASSRTPGRWRTKPPAAA